MAKESYKIEIGGNSVSVPAWATKEQLDKLLITDAQIIKNLEALLRNDKIFSNRVIKQNDALLKSVTSGNAAVVKAVKTLTAEEKKAAEQARAESKARREWAKKQRDSEQRFMNVMKKSGDAMRRGAGEFTGKLASGLKTGSLKDIAGAIGGVVGLGTAFGAMAGIVEEFGKSLSDMSSVGAGLGQRLNDLRSAAADAGLDMAKFGKVIIENSQAINSLGGNTSDGAMAFARLSKQVRESARTFNFFGLSNEEMNQVLAQEIELRRQSGQTTAQITAQVASGMNDLLKETSAMAALTGQDRREMLRRRQEVLNETSVKLMQQSFERSGRMTSDVRGKVTSISDIVGKADSGLANALIYSAMSGQDFRSVEGGKYAQMAAYGGPEFAAAMDDMSKFIRLNLENKNMTPEEFSNALLPMLQRLGVSASQSQLQSLAVLSKNDQNAAEFATLIANITGNANMGGKFTTPSEVAGARAEALGGFEKTAIMALPATLEDMSNRIKASALNTVLDQLAVNINNGGQELVSALNRFGSNFGGDRGIFEGMAGAGADLMSANPALGLLGAGALGYGGYKVYKAGSAIVRGAGRVLGGTGRSAKAKPRSGSSGRAAGGFFSNPRIRGGLKGFGIGSAVGFGADLAADALGRDTVGGQLANTASYAATGAGTGAMIGSVIPGLGTAIGGTIGGILGTGYGIYDSFFSDKDNQVSQNSADPVTHAQLAAMSSLLEQILAETRRSRVELENMS